MTPFSAAVEILVTDHAMWRAAERFPGFDTLLIEDDVRGALANGRVSPDRRQFGITAGSRTNDLYVCSADETRIYVIRPDRYRPDRWVVVTSMDVLEFETPRNRQEGAV